MLARPLIGMVCFGILSEISLAVAALEPLTERSFERLHLRIKPCAAEQRWTAIPWRSDLWAARRDAEREHKPLLIWSMDGHPLGCT